MLKKHAQGNMALDLTQLLARDKLDLVKMFGPMATGYSIDGKPYSFPTKIDQYGLVLNKTMFEAAGIPIPTSCTRDERIGDTRCRSDPRPCRCLRVHDVKA